MIKIVFVFEDYLDFTAVFNGTHVPKCPAISPMDMDTLVFQTLIVWSDSVVARTEDL
jgi:hypothetical protein